MKKLLFVLAILFLLPLSVFAAATPRIITLEATSKDNEIKYNGTIEPGSYAVMCKLYNDSDEEIDLLSSPVEDQKFEGSFANVEAGKYQVACANYEGGDVKKVDVTVDETIAKEDNPKTGDNIVKYMIIAGVAVVGLVAGVLIVKKKK